MIFKRATFSPEFICYHRLGLEPNQNFLCECLNKTHATKPPLMIYSSPMYSLRVSDQALLAAEVSLQMMEYLETHGPLLANVELNEELSGSTDPGSDTGDPVEPF